MADSIQHQIDAFQPMLAKEWKSKDINIANYLVSEKLDGIRAIWIGDKFVSRTWKPICAPEWFKNLMPKNQILDGELFSQRNDFQKIISTCRKKIPKDEEWKKITYCVFDLPLDTNDAKTRYEKLKHIFDNNQCSNIKLVQQYHVDDMTGLEDLYQSLLEKGAEGLMLKESSKPYDFKRSSNLFKYKPFQDKEAVVTQHDLGLGKYKDKLGSLQVKWDHNGQIAEFNVGSGLTDELRSSYKTSIPIGQIVKIKYSEINPLTGRPRFPVFLGIKDTIEL